MNTRAATEWADPDQLQQTTLSWIYVGTLRPDLLQSAAVAEPARFFAFSAEAYRVDMEHVRDVGCPFFAHLNDGHFVVVYHTNDRRVVVADPTSGVQSITLQWLQENWSGYSLVVRR